MTEYNIPNGTWIHLKGNITLLGFLMAKQAVCIDVTRVWLCGILIACMGEMLYFVDNDVLELWWPHMSFVLSRKTVLLSEISRVTIIPNNNNRLRSHPWPLTSLWSGGKQRESFHSEDKKYLQKATLSLSLHTHTQLKVKLLPTVTHYRVPCVDQLICVCVWVWDGVEGERGFLASVESG